MFFFKKLVSRFLFPLPFCCELLIAGLALWQFTKLKKTGRGLILAGTLLLLLFSYPWLPNRLLGSIEDRVTPVSLPVHNPEGPVYVAVLGQGISAKSRLPANERFDEEFLTRLMEAVRLHRAMPQSLLVISAAGQSVSAQEKRHVVDDLLGLFDVGSQGVILQTTARDTSDEIRFLKQVACTNRVYLVSTASHLPRALVIARKDGLNAVPAPSSYFIDRVTHEPFSPEELFPDADNLWNSTRAFYEYMGLAWEHVRR